MARLVVLLPCLNEARNLPGLFNSLAQLQTSLGSATSVSVLVVDDGSTDDTARVAGSWSGLPEVVLVQHGTNLGLGAALKTGILWFAEHCADQPEACLAALDADGTHPPELLAELLAADADIVIASRYAPGGEEHGLSALRRFYSRGASLALSIVARVRGARDYTCGYRLYRQPILMRGLERFGNGLVTETGFVCMAELLIKLSRCDARVCEVPLKLHYELKGGPSKMNVPATISRYFALALKAMFSPAWR